MTLIQVWGCLLIFVLCPLLGGLPATEWLSQRLPAPIGQRSVNRRRVLWFGVEACKGIASVGLARYYFPADPTWWIIALIALMFGQFWLRKSKQVLGVVAGCIAYSWQVAFLMLLMGGISLTVNRERRLGRLGLLILFPLLVGLYAQESSQVIAAMGLSCLLAWMDEQPIVTPTSSRPENAGDLMTQTPADDAHLFGFFQRDRNIRTLDHPLNGDQVGQPAATLSQLKAWGYNVPSGWVLPPGDDADPLIRFLDPSPQQPLMIRPAVVGNKNHTTHPHPVLEPIVQITSRRALAHVIGACRTAYSSTPSSPQHLDRGVAILIQVQVEGQYGGFAWSQDIKIGEPASVLITAGIGQTPADALTHTSATQIRVSASPESASNSLSLSQLIPADLVSEIAAVAREIEAHYHGIPQKIEWSYDGTTLWVLEVNPLPEEHAYNT